MDNPKHELFSYPPLRSVTIKFEVIVPKEKEITLKAVGFINRLERQGISVRALSLRVEGETFAKGGE